MNQVRASRLSNEKGNRHLFLGDSFPEGSLKRKLFFWGVLPLLFLLILYWLVNSLIMPSITRHGTEFELPDYIGLQYLESEQKLKELKLFAEKSSEQFSPGLEKGVIISQYPKSGTKVKEDRTIRFAVSIGKKFVPIPNMAGKSVRQAMLDLESTGLLLGEIAWAFSDTLPERVVVFSYPSAATEIPLGSPVNIMVNRGRASRFTYMPNVTGMPLSEAIKKIKDKSLKVGIVTYRTDENYLPETILEQSESEGTELDVGTEIDLVASTTE